MIKKKMKVSVKILPSKLTLDQLDMIIKCLHYWRKKMDLCNVTFVKYLQFTSSGLSQGWESLLVQAELLAASAAATGSSTAATTRAAATSAGSAAVIATRGTLAALSALLAAVTGRPVATLKPALATVTTLAALAAVATLEAVSALAAISAPATAAAASSTSSGATAGLVSEGEVDLGDLLLPVGSLQIHDLQNMSIKLYNTSFGCNYSICRTHPG